MTKGLSRGDGMVDARGVLIEPGDVVIYGFGVSRSVAMAEGRIRDDGYGHVSTSPSGRVWVTIVRRSYGDGKEDRVHIAPDRMVVLKVRPGTEGPNAQYVLPYSPLPTQDEVNRDAVVGEIEQDSDELGEILGGAPPPDWAYKDSLRFKPVARTEDEARQHAVDFYRRTLPELLNWLAEIETRLPCCQRPGHTSPAEPRCACPCHLYREELGLE